MSSAESSAKALGEVLQWESPFALGEKVEAVLVRIDASPTGRIYVYDLYALGVWIGTVETPKDGKWEVVL